MAFTTPIQTTAQGASSTPAAPSASTSNMQAISSLASSLAPVVGSLFQPEDKTNEIQGQVNKLATQYQSVKSERGGAAAERWLATQYTSNLSGLNSAGKSVFQDSFKTTFGESPIKSDRDAEIKLLEQKAQAEQENKIKLSQTGALVVTSIGQDPSEFTEEQLIRYGRKQDAEQMRLSAEAQRLANRSQDNSLNQSESVQTATLAAQSAIGTLGVAVDAGVEHLALNIQSDPAKAEALKSQYNSNISYQITRGRAAFDEAVTAAGGNPADVPNSYYERYLNRLKSTRDFINSEHIKTRNATREAIQASDAMQLLRDRNPTAYNLSLWAPNLMPNIETALKTASSGAQAADSTNSTIQAVTDMWSSSPAQARLSAGSNSTTPYLTVGSVFDYVYKMDASVQDEYNTKGGEIVAAALMDSISPNRKVRENANNSTGMHRAIQTMKNHNFTPESIQAIRTAVEDNGMPLEDVMQGRLSTFLTETLVPSLRPPQLSDASKLPYSVSVKGSRLRLEPVTDQERSPSEFSAVASAVGNSDYRQRLKKMEIALNDELIVYSKLTGGDIEDLLPVINAGLGIRQAIEEIQPIDGMTGATQPE